MSKENKEVQTTITEKCDQVVQATPPLDQATATPGVKVMASKEVQTTPPLCKVEKADQATANPGVKVMASKEVQTTPPRCKVEEAAQEALAINPELKNNPEFQKFLCKK